MDQTEKIISPYELALKRMLSSPQSIKLGLERIHELMNRLENPQNNFKIFHVAGTNGKGSTCAFLGSILSQAGYKCGRFVSPHLSCVRERFLINDEMISESDFIWAEQEIQRVVSKMAEPPSFFECMMAVGALVFTKNKVEVAVFEVGLGGRLDATNILQPIVCGISQIGLDHCAILGESLELIAEEKSKIIKPGVPVVVSAQEAVVLEVIKKAAKAQQAPLWIVGADIFATEEPDHKIEVRNSQKILLRSTSSGLKGTYQGQNLALAIGMIEKSGLVLEMEPRVAGTQQAKWPGRFETIERTAPERTATILLDGAHNPAASKVLFEAIKNDARFCGRFVVAVVGMSQGHDSFMFAKVWQEKCRELNLPMPHKLILTKASPIRSVPAEQLQPHFDRADFKTEIVDDPLKALDMAEKIASSIDGYVLVTGSLYLVGQIRAFLCNVPVDPVLPLH